MTDLPDETGLTRRELLELSVASAALAGTRGWSAEAAPARSAAGDAIETAVTLRINATSYHLTLDPRTSLLDALRHQLALTGSKKGCDHGQCGACTVLVNGRRINACLTLAVMHDGDEITTIEGLANGEALHPLQAAFIKHDGFQCGYCTPGQICSAAGLLSEVKAGWASYATDDLTKSPALSGAEIRERMSGNICRCAAYPNIVAAIIDASGEA